VVHKQAIRTDGIGYVEIITPAIEPAAVDRVGFSSGHRPYRAGKAAGGEPFTETGTNEIEWPRNDDLET
jgi:hypothetical protein